jgi:hypothetical protein
LVDFSDVAVRAAAQLQLFRNKKPIRDKEVLARAVEFLEAAKAGGMFMSSGDSANLHATLRPLNWALDARSSEAANLWSAEPEEIDYSDVTRFLARLQSTILKVMEGDFPDEESCEECVAFLDRLGETLGTRADQHMRAVSLPSTSVASF